MTDFKISIKKSIPSKIVGENLEHPYHLLSVSLWPLKMQHSPASRTVFLLTSSMIRLLPRGCHSALLLFLKPKRKNNTAGLVSKKTILHRENRAELFVERPWTTSLGNNQRKHWFRSFWTPVSFWLHCPKQTAVSLLFSLGSSSQLDCKTLFLDSVDSCLSTAKILCRHFDSLNGYDVKILNTKFCQIRPWPKNQILQCLLKKQNNDATPTGLLFHKALMWTQEQEHNNPLSLNNDIYTTYFHVATKSKSSPEVKPECMGDAWCFFLFILGWHVSKYAKYKLC